MRLNKMKLAAAMMSAVMAASSMPVTAFAADFTDGGAGVEAQADFVEVVETPEAEARSLSLKPNSITYDAATKKASYVYIGDDGKEQTKEVVDAVITVSDPVCGEKAIAHVVGKTHWGLAIDAYCETGDVLEHVYAGNKTTWVVTTEATCEKDGEKTEYKVCDNCGAVSDQVVSTATITKAHNYGTNKEIVSYENLGSNVQLGKTGVPELKDTAKDNDATNCNQYTMVTKKKCNTCQIEQEIKTETITLKATTAKLDHAKVTGVTDNLDNTYYTSYVEGKDPKDVKLDEVILYDCSKDGAFTVTEYSDKDENDVLRTYKVTVPKHHTAGKVEAKAVDSKDQSYLNVTKDKDGKPVVTNKSCYKTISYVETTYCGSTKCTLDKKVMSSETKEAAPAGGHEIAKSVKDEVKKLTDSETTNGAATQNDYDAFLEYANGSNSGVKYESNIECGKSGSVTITYLCDACGKETEEKVTVKVEKLEHKEGNPTQENVVEATCAAKGSYDLVTPCKYCGIEMNRKKVEVPMLKHSFEKVEADGSVTQDETNAYIKFNGTKVIDNDGENLDNVDKAFEGTYAYRKVTADAVIDCTVCNEAVAIEKELPLTVVSIKKEADNGKAGSITLKTEYTKNLKDGKTEKITKEYTVPYYSDWLAYLERNPDAKDGLVRDDDGVFRYYKDGEFQENYTGLVDFNGETFYVENGVDTYKDGVVRTGEKTFYFLSLGRVVKEHNGFAMYDGNWFIIKDGKVDLTANGLFKYNGGTFLFTTGGLRRDVTGLWLEESTGTWYYLHEGQVQDQFTGTTWYDGQQFELVNGKLVK